MDSSKRLRCSSDHFRAASPEVDAVLNSTPIGKVELQNAVRQYADILDLRGEGSFIKTIGIKHLSADRTEPILPHAFLASSFSGQRQ